MQLGRNMILDLTALLLRSLVAVEFCASSLKSNVMNNATPLHRLPSNGSDLRDLIGRCGKASPGYKPKQPSDTEGERENEAFFVIKHLSPDKGGAFGRCSEFKFCGAYRAFNGPAIQHERW